MKSLRIILFSLMIFLPFHNSDAVAQGNNKGGWWQFENRGWFLPLVSEPRASELKVNLGLISRYAFADSTENFGDDPRRGIDMSVGKEVPFFGWESVLTKNQRFKPGKGGIGLWIPISFHMLWDLAATSYPIVNTDYRFGFMLKGEMGLENHRWIGARWTFFGHESSHLGDELSLSAKERFPAGGVDPPFERINVSNEFWEIELSYETTDFLEVRGSAIVRLGLSGLYHPNEKGFYSFDPTETNGREIFRSKRNLEPHLGLEWWGGTRIKLPFKALATFPFVSAHYGPRIVYNFQKQDPSELEEIDWTTFNLILGITDRAYDPANVFGHTDFHLRFYRGVNPHGQFRNERDYLILAIGMTVHT